MLKEQLQVTEQLDSESRQRLREVQVDTEMWKLRWDQTQEQLSESWRQYDTMQTRWEEAEERVLVIRRCWERDRRRLREAERLLREIGRPLDPPREDEEPLQVPTGSSLVERPCDMPSSPNSSG